MAAIEKAGIMIFPSGKFCVSTDEVPEAIRVCVDRLLCRGAVEGALSRAVEPLFDNSFFSTDRLGG